MKTPHRRLQRCTWPTSLPRSDFGWKIVRAGVHDQLWQKSFGKGMRKKQFSGVSFQLSVRTHVSSGGNEVPHVSRFSKPGTPDLFYHGVTETQRNAIFGFSPA